MLESKTAKWLAGVTFLALLAAGAASWYAAYSEQHELEARVDALTHGDAKNGRELAQSKGCSGCHTIPGTEGPQGNVGPPLTKFASRVYIAGVLLNTPDYLRQWLLNPPQIDSKTAMPNVGLSDQEARDLCAFLYTLN
jgi:cytochrome c